MRGIRTPSTDCSSAEPSPIFPCRPRPKATKRSPGLQRKSHTRELTDAIARHRSLRPIARIMRGSRAVHVPDRDLDAPSNRARARRPRRVLQSIDRFAKFIEEASIASPCRLVGFAPFSKLKAEVTSMRSRLAVRWA